MRLTLLLLVLLASLSFSLAPATAGDDEGLVRKAFDVSTLITPRRHAYTGRIGSPSPARHYPGLSVEFPEPQPFLEAEQLVELIRTSVARETWETVRGASIESAGPWLRVANRPTVVAQVESVLRQLSVASGRRVLVTVRASQGKAQAFPSSVPEAGLEESGTLEVPPGVARSLRVENRISFVADYDAEIAQGSTILNPNVFDGIAGMAATVQPHLFNDGETIILDAVVHRGQYAEGREHELGVDEEYFAAPYRSHTHTRQGIVELPRFEHVGVRFTASVKSGGSVTIPVLSGGRLTQFTFTAEVLGGSSSPWVLETSVLTTTPLPFRFDHRPAEAMDRDDWRFLAPQLYAIPDDDEARAPKFDSDMLLDMIRSAVQPQMWEEGEVWSESNILDRLVLFGSDALSVTDGVRDFLQAEEGRAINPLVLDVRVYERGAVPASGTEVEFDETQGELVRAIRVPALSGWPVSIVDGLTANYLADYDVEVAQEARIADPLVGQVFGGLVLNALPRLTIDGRHAEVDLRLSVSALDIDEEPFHPRAQTLGPVDRVRKKRALMNTTLRIPVGGRYVLDAGPSPFTSGRRLAIVVRVERP